MDPEVLVQALLFFPLAAFLPILLRLLSFSLGLCSFDVQKFDEYLRAILYGINDEVLNEGDIPLRDASMLTEDKGNLRYLLKNRPWTYESIIEQHPFYP